MTDGMTPLAIDYSRAARANDPATSVEAASRVKEFAHRHHSLIVASLMTFGAGTIHHIAARTGLDHVAVARRMNELLECSLVERTGGKWPSPTGRPCDIWRIFSGGAATQA